MIPLLSRGHLAAIALPALCEPVTRRTRLANRVDRGHPNVDKRFFWPCRLRPSPSCTSIPSLGVQVRGTFLFGIVAAIVERGSNGTLGRGDTAGATRSSWNAAILAPWSLCWSMDLFVGTEMEEHEAGGDSQGRSCRGWWDLRISFSSPGLRSARCSGSSVVALPSLLCLPAELEPTPTIPTGREGGGSWAGVFEFRHHPDGHRDRNFRPASLARSFTAGHRSTTETTGPFSSFRRLPSCMLLSSPSWGRLLDAVPRPPRLRNLIGEHDRTFDEKWVMPLELLQVVIWGVPTRRRLPALAEAFYDVERMQSILFDRMAGRRRALAAAIPMIRWAGDRGRATETPSISASSWSKRAATEARMASLENSEWKVSFQLDRHLVDLAGELLSSLL